MSAMILEKKSCGYIFSYRRFVIIENLPGIANDEEPSAEEIKQSVIDGQLAYENDKTDQFTKIDRKDLWK